MFKDQILDNKNRRIIYEIIRKNPTIHLRQLEKLSGLPFSTINYHADYLRRKKIIIQEKDGRLLRFYIKPLDKEDKRLLKVLRQKRFREIVSLLLIKKKVNFKFLKEKLNIPRSTLSLYLQSLLNNKILIADKIGYKKIYSLINEDKIVKILITYKSSLLDRIVDKTLNTWLETQFGSKNR